MYKKNIMTSSRKSSQVQSLSSVINRLRGTLRNMIDLEHGLLDIMRSLDVLSWNEMEVIDSLTTDLSKIDRMFDFVTCLSPAGLTSFTVALVKTQQIHVRNYIVLNGLRSSHFGEDWPLVDSEICGIIQSNLSDLEQLIDPINGLLEELLSVGCINFQHMRRIEAQDDNVAKNALLLSVLLKRSVGDFNNFICFLVKTKQYRAASLLGAKLTFADRPLNEKRYKKMSALYSSLVDLIDIGKEDGVVARLAGDDCITWRQREFIENAPSASQRNKRLLDVIMRGSESCFEKFVRCLIHSGQRHVCRLLGVERMIAKTSGPARTLLYSRTHLLKTHQFASSIKRSEERIVNEFMQILRHSNEERKSQILEYFASITDDVSLIGVPKH